MWMTDGRKLSGSYGTWRGREVELRERKPRDGKYCLVQEGGERPGPEWREMFFPASVGSTSYRYYHDVPETEVSDVHSIEATGYVMMTSIGGFDVQAPVQIVAQDESGRLFVECYWDNRDYWSDLKREFDFEENERAWVYGWIPGHRSTDIQISRNDHTNQ
ncbi:hypothetical protein [Crystallibacter degradans]|uniref:hypothetical protein n=1 Tax=Crystallibacter degradans TaxID=2726743 RepID=UPI0014743C4E|nr:hypothetical protein [Arthrobacter sp. SF27]NMR32473.1 hypothetical protein [Arthrobacter sp. SF27]